MNAVLINEIILNIVFLISGILLLTVDHKTPKIFGARNLAYFFGGIATISYHLGYWTLEMNVISATLFLFGEVLGLLFFVRIIFDKESQWYRIIVLFTIITLISSLILVIYYRDYHPEWIVDVPYVVIPLSIIGAPLLISAVVFLLRFESLKLVKSNVGNKIIAHGFMISLLAHFVYFYSYELNQIVNIIANILIAIGYVQVARTPEIFDEMDRFRRSKKLRQELSAAKQQLETLTNQSEIGVIITIKKSVAYVNEYFSKLTGSAKAEVEKWTIDDIVSFFTDKTPKTAQETKVAFKDILTSKDFYIINQNDDTIYLEVFADKIRYKGKDAYQIVVLDRTEPKKLEDERDKERLKRTQLETVSLLAGGIAHDFNNILVSILGNISLLEIQANLNPAQRELIKNSKKGTLRARDLVTQLLTFSKGDSLVKESASIVEIIRESSALILSGSKSVCLIDVKDDIPPIDVDVTQFSQVINNLLMNAKQAMPDGGKIYVTIDLVSLGGIQTSKLKLRRGKYVRIKIKDEGLGIPKDIRDKVFLPYFTTKEKGNGLGLATSYSIIQKHGGHLNFESEEGKGTTFHIYLPSISSKMKQKDNVQKEREVELEGKRILVLDDEEGVHEFLEVFFGEFGAETDSVWDGDSALALAQKNRYDLIIMDVTIAGGKGAGDIILDFRKTDKKTPVIVSSGFTEDRIMTDFKKLGFNDYLKKPYTSDELLGKIRTCLL